MKYDFDTPVDRLGTSCLKWDYLEAFFGKADLNAMWVADMDFKAPPEILDPIIRRAEHGVFGYTAKPDGFFDAVTAWFAKRYNWPIKRDWIVATPGVVPALNLALQEFTEPGDGVIIQPPVYFPFEESIRLNGRKTLNNPLVLENGQYRMNFQELEQLASEAKVLVLCTPHNPVGRVWKKGELETLGEICEKHGLFVFSDEIHADIIYRHAVHTPTAKISSYLLEHSISAYATSKTFNLAGLQMSVNVIPCEEVRTRFKNCISRLHMGMSNIFGITGTQAAYAHGEEWLEELLCYLWNNYTAVNEYITGKIPGISVLEPQGTFLLWLDCRELGLTDEELSSLMVNRAGLALSPGQMFGAGGEGFMRLNIASPRAQIMRGLEKLKDAVLSGEPVPEPCVCTGGPDDT